MYITAEAQLSQKIALTLKNKMGQKRLKQKS